MRCTSSSSPQPSGLRNWNPSGADDEMTSGIVHKPMFERLILCEYAVLRSPTSAGQRHELVWLDLIFFDPREWIAE
jgi:hypothetical protein